MRYWPFLLVGIILVALDWAALHDILKREPNVTAEWIVIAASGLMFGVMLGILFRSKKLKD